MRSALPGLVFACAVIGCGGGRLATVEPTARASAADSEPALELTWSDEFDGGAGALPDPARWTYDYGTAIDGWGNSELQYYSDRADNVSMDGQGHLVIAARREDFKGKPYTSGRIKTAGLFEQMYGRFEARIKVPIGRGLWPAFWMLGESCVGAMCTEGDTGWPQAGEIDIMEYLGQTPSMTLGTIHGPGYAGDDSLSTTYTLPDGQRFHDDFHVFAVDWRPDRIEWTLDGTVYATKTRADVEAKGPWVFDQPFYIILNIAVGGAFPGAPDETAIFPQQMVVDYVRVYKYAP